MHSEHTTPFRLQQSEWKEGYTHVIHSPPHAAAQDLASRRSLEHGLIRANRPHPQQRTQANLRIEAKVVLRPSTIVTKTMTKVKTRTRTAAEKITAVSYNLNPRHEEFSVTEEQRSMLVDSGNTVRQEQVRAITVVPK